MNSKDILVPRNLDDRKEKLKQHNLRMLQQKVITGSLIVDDTFNFLQEEVNTRFIDGNVVLKFNLGRIPEWLKNVRVYGYFDCSNCNLTSLNGCPYEVKNFYADRNDLTSLNGAPKFVKGSMYVYNNNLNNLEGMPEFVGEDVYLTSDFHPFLNFDIESAIPKNVTIMGSFKNLFRSGMGSVIK